ncbi:ABC transporter permease [Asticcacaulis sp. 201]|uniref:ABC transporter permease n=1 Tax=Asticcacaulis sp. 201 TaxID=3028787 RepID=UPI002915C627|nr:ABC transporter permease [Asticcacaulis sp. 201]MDV6331041.1 ABC transporter permease [Asticcacaulis sp. 201]
MSEMLSVSTRTWNGYADLLDGCRNWRLWLFLGYQDVRQRYARSILGPFWLVMGLGVTIIGIGFLYSQIMKTDPGKFLPYIAISLAAWNFISAVINESTSIFQASASLIKSIMVPYSSVILRAIVKNLIVFAHYMVAVVVTFALTGYSVDYKIIFAIPGILLISLNLVWISIILGMMCARFRDMAQMTQYAMQLAQFATPVVWMPSQVHPNSPYLLFNPIYHLIELIRAPIFEHVIPGTSFIFCTVMLVVGTAVTLVVFNKHKKLINFWL